MNDALKMAQNCAASIDRLSAYQVSDPLGAYIAQSGRQGMDAADLAAGLALVSIAEDLRRIADHLVPYPPQNPDDA